MRTVGEALVEYLAALDTQYIFGIPGVHTVEMYRALARLPIQHITPRHEQCAGFMADGYARVSGRPGVCLLITGPGLTNAITAIAQALRDSIPMLVISGVNASDTLGLQRGHLHELPDQRGLMQQLLPYSSRLTCPRDLPALLAEAYQVFASQRPQPVHIEVPLEIMAMPMPDLPLALAPHTPKTPNATVLAGACKTLQSARNALVLLGGGAQHCGSELKEFLDRIDAPVISTANARSLLRDHPLHVPASASMSEVRAAIAKADVVVALGTEFGPTDYDVYEDGQFPAMQALIRVDIDETQLIRGPKADFALCGDLSATLTAALEHLPEKPKRQGAERARALCAQAAKNAWVQSYASVLDYIDATLELLPDCAIVGDSTQAMYAANLLHRGQVPAAWFNSATGYGTLGYAPGAAIGAALANPGRATLCWIGDGGMQFSLADIGAAADAEVPVIFVIWNNRGFQEIENCMREKNIDPVGVRPSAPDFCLVAKAYGVPGQQVSSLSEYQRALQGLAQTKSPVLIEILTE